MRRLRRISPWVQILVGVVVVAIGLVLLSLSAA
jgi:hypothetical protein